MYIPKSQIKENLYTAGGEWWYVDDGTEYVGFYYKLSNGKAFSGKNMNEMPSRQIFQRDDAAEFELHEDFHVDSDETGINWSQIADNYDGIIDGTKSNFSEGNIQQPKDVDTYLNIKGIDATKVKHLPDYKQTIPIPEDYEVGFLTRYFVVQTNALIYLEIDKETYDALIGENGDWEWQAYIPFTIRWTITGKMDAVFVTNKNIISLKEKEIKRKGLTNYLSNKLEYYLYTEGENLLAEPNLLITGTGEDYVGYYHIHPLKGPMEGPFHVNEPHQKLYFKRFYKVKGLSLKTEDPPIPNTIVLGVNDANINYEELNSTTTSTQEGYESNESQPPPSPPTQPPAQSPSSPSTGGAY